VSYARATDPITVAVPPTVAARKQMVGVDVFVNWSEGSPDELGARLETFVPERLQLSMISNRGQKVWPGGNPETFCVDHWRCRYEATGDGISHRDVIDLLARFDDQGLDFVKTEGLFTFDGEPGYSKGQGQ
jgi:isocitrate dehydrogenase